MMFWGRMGTSCNAPALLTRRDETRQTADVGREMGNRLTDLLMEPHALRHGWFSCLREITNRLFEIKNKPPTKRQAPGTGQDTQSQACVRCLT